MKFSYHCGPLQGELFYFGIGVVFYSLRGRCGGGNRRGGGRFRVRAGWQVRGGARGVRVVSGGSVALWRGRRRVGVCSRGCVGAHVLVCGGGFCRGG